MFIIAQIPFIDLRLLTEEAEKKYKDCIFPNNFTKKMNPSTYYRYLGKEKLRHSSDALPESERQFFNSPKLLWLNEDVQMRDDPYQPKLIFSRLFTDAQFFHFDVGIREVTKENFQRKDLDKFISQFMKLPLFGIRKQRSSDRRWYSFPELAEQIKKLYLYATEREKGVTGDLEQKKAHSYKVELGHPALFITYNRQEISVIRDARQITLDSGIEVWYKKLPVGNFFIDIWFLGKNDLSRYNQELRNLRIYLSKLHSYKESLRIILRCLRSSNDFDKDRIVCFFEYMVSYMNRDKFYGYSNEDFWELVFAIDDQYDRVTWNEYKKQINAYIHAVRAAVNINNGIIVEGNVGGKAIMVTHSSDVNVSASD